MYRHTYVTIYQLEDMYSYVHIYDYRIVTCVRNVRFETEAQIRSHFRTEEYAIYCPTQKLFVCNRTDAKSICCGISNGCLII